MMLNTKIMRPAIAMLELIFAIVIMGIILMSAPQLISTASQSGFVAIQQEGINEAASQVNMIMGHHWDENDADESYIDPILRTAGDTDLNELVPTGRRLGTPEESYRSFIRSDGANNLAASATGTFGTADGNETTEDDIDDFSGSVKHLVFVPETTLETNVADYIETATINIARNVVYSSDSANYNQSTITFNPSFSAAADTTNIKSIIVTLTSASSEEELNQKKITLRAFSCNIGGYKLDEREF